MPNTYEPIATATANGSVASFTFSSIPSTYTDLVLVGNSGAVGNSFIVLQQFNGSSSNLMSTTLAFGTGSAAGSWRSASNVNTIYLAYNSFPLGALDQSYVAHFLNYSNTNVNKTVVARYNWASGETGMVVGLYRSTAAINSFVVLNSGGVNFIAGSTFTLYGIKAA